MYQCMVTVSVILLSVIGCKTTPSSDDKVLDVGLRKGKQIGKIADQAFFIRASRLAETKPVRDAVRKAIDDGDLGDLKKLIKGGDALGEAAGLAYYRVFKGEQDKFVEKVDWHINKFDEIKKDTNKMSTHFTPSEKVNSTVAYVQYLSEVMRDFSSLLEKRVKQVDEIVSSVKGKDEKFDALLSLCCSTALRTTQPLREMSGSSVVKNRKYFRDIFQTEHQSIRTALDSSKTTSLRESSKEFYDKAGIEYSQDEKIEWNFSFANLGEARIEIADKLRNYRASMEALMGD